MGYFSWLTSDTNRSISNVESSRGAFKVTMLLPNGSKITEDAYEGYGIFGGVSFYHTVYQLNSRNLKFKHILEQDWSEEFKGIMMLDYREPNRDFAITPKFVEDDSLRWEDLPNPVSCKNQGFFYN